jgi:hypothetical protein
MIVKPTAKIKEQGILRWTYFYMCALAGVEGYENIPRTVARCDLCTNMIRKGSCLNCPISKKSDGCRLFWDWLDADGRHDFNKAERLSKRMLEIIERIKI